MAAKPWFDSSDIIETVKRRISFPIDQSTFTEDDILKFANEEMAISQIPSILEFHEEYLVTSKSTPLIGGQSRYPMPDRAIGMKLRDLAWQDSTGNFFEMTQINAEDKAFFQRNIGANAAIHKFYVEGNDVVLTPRLSDGVTGSLIFFFYIRPNQLVSTDRAITISSFTQTITVDNAFISAGDTLTFDGNVTLIAVSGSPSTNEFAIGVSSIATAANLAAAISMYTDCTGDSGSPSTTIVTVRCSDLDNVITTSNSSGFSIPSDVRGIEFSDDVPSIFSSGELVDFLQTKPGHKIRAYDVQIPNGAVSTNSILFNSSDIPPDLIVGDYICLANECIIPQIPPDLHNTLAERTCARILAAMGDQAGLQVTTDKIKEMEQWQGTLLENRVEGAPKKITARHSLLRYGQLYSRRRV